MAASTRLSSRQSDAASMRALIDELRTIVHSCHERQQLLPSLTNFLDRHRLTQRDVAALVVALSNQEAVVTADGAREEEPPPALRPSGEQIRDETPDVDLGWMFGEGAEPTDLPAVDDAVGRALDDLLGDWSRRGGQLSRAEVALLAKRRGLSSAQYGELLDLLKESGVELTETEVARTQRGTRKEPELQDDSLGQYLRDLGRYRLIDATREVELWSLISQGQVARAELDAAEASELSDDVRRSLQDRVADGRRAHAELVCANLRLVVSVAKEPHYQGCGVELADRIQDGNLGLMRAADKFDGSKGYKFSTYATWWIRQAIDRGVQDRGRTIRLPVYVQVQLRKIRKAVTRLTYRHGRAPTADEISELTGLDPGQVQSMLELDRPLRSLDMLLGEDGDLRLSDLISDDEERDGRTDPAKIVLHAMLREDLQRAMRNVLSGREVQVVERRFGLGTWDVTTLEEIAADFGLSRERIRQIQTKALKKLRESSEAAGLLART